jgi:primosomal protein N' (replication factor Y)
MKVIHVIPISRGVLLDKLSYFTSIDVPLGKTVLVPLRKKMIHAVVIGKEDASEIKSELKSSTFALRKMENVETHQFLTTEFIKSAEETAEYFASSTGNVLNTLIPKTLLNNLNTFTSDAVEQKNISEKTSPEQMVLQADDEERFVNYKSLIREEFAKNLSVFMCVPTIEDIKKTESALEKGIEQYTYVFHSGLNKKEFINLWNKLLKEEHPVLIIGTGQYMCVPKQNIGTIILEREGSRAYKVPNRPFIDIRTFAQIYAKKIKARLLLGDTLLRTETIWQLKKDKYVEFSPLKFRSVTSATQLIVDTRKNPEEKEITFSTISKEAEKLIEWNRERNENLFIFGVRKGLAPLTVCGDCGTVTACSVCSSAVMLHAGPEENFFQCNTCGKKRSAKEKCKNCDSWKLVTLGVGIELIEKEVRAKFPDLKIFKIDAQSVTTHKKALDIANKFYNTPGSVLIGTQMAMLYLNKKIENAIVASIDPLFSLPDFRINEIVLSILLKIRTITKENFILQTRDPEKKLFDQAIKGNLVDFYRDEIEEREVFKYPPFSTFIKITLQGEKDAVENEMKKIPELFAPYETDIFPAFIKKIRGKHIMHALIKIPEDKWIDKAVLKNLRSLPPQFMTKIDPESIL